MKTFILLLALTAIAYSGQIYQWSDPQYSKFNTDLAPTATFYINLDNHLRAFSYFRVVLPFAFTGTLSATVYTPSSRCGDPQASLGPAVATGTLSASGISGDTNAFFGQLSADLTKGTNYAISLTFSTTVASAAAGLAGTIALYTTTDNAANYMIIDQNPHFANFEWAAATAALTVADNTPDAAGLSTVTNSLGLTYGFNFSFTPTQAYVGGGLVVITLSNSKFQIPAAPQCTVTLTNGVPANYSCNLVGPSLQIAIPDYVPAQKVYVKFQVTNPAIVDTSSVSVSLNRRFNGQVLEQATGSGWLTSNFATTWDATASGFQISWGTPISATANNPLKIFKNTANTAYYQSVRVVMKPTAAIPQGYKLRLTIDLGDEGASGANYHVQEASINHNLDSHDTNAKVICTAPFNTGATTRKISCDNVNLGSSKAYYVAFKIKVMAASLSAVFGTATLEARMQPDGSSPSSTLNLVSALVGTVPTPTAIDAMWDPTVSTTPDTVDPPLGVVAPNTMYYDSTATTNFLKIWATSDSDTAAHAIGSSTVTNTGFDVYMNKYVTCATPVDGTIGLFATSYAEADSATAFTYGDYYAASSTQPYNRVRGGFATVPALASGAAATAWYIKFKKITIARSPSLRADEASFEVYVGIIAGYSANGTLDTALTYSKPGMISLLSMTGPGATPGTSFAGLGIGVAAAYTGDTTTRYPALIRIAGALAATTEATSTTSKLVVFFQNLAPYAANKYNDYTVNCTGSSGTNNGTGLSCTYIGGETVSANTDPNIQVFQPRLEIVWPGVFNATTAFQLLIPAIPVAGATNFYFATMDSTTSSPLRMLTGTAITQAALAAATPDYATAGNTARFTPAATDKVGATVSNNLKIATTTSATSTAFGTAGNLNSWTSGAVKTSAGFQFCGSYNFLAASATFGTNALGDATKEDKCLTYSVNLASAAALGTNKAAGFATGDTWCVFCPASAVTTLSSGVNVAPVTNFKLWNGGKVWTKQTTAITPSPAVGCIFKNDGSALFCDDSTDTVTAGVINATFNPTTMTTATTNMKQTITLALTNPLPAGTSKSTIYLRFTTAIFLQESGADCRISFNGGADTSCTFTPSATAPAADTDEVTSTVNPGSITGYTVPDGGATAVIITLYGIKTSLTAAGSTTITVSTRTNWGSGANVWSTQLDLQTTGTAFTVTLASGTAAAPMVSPIRYSFTQRGARSTLQIGFMPAGRDIYRKERVVIQWNSANYTNAPNTVGSSSAPGLYCEVYDQATNDFLAQFKSCAIDATAITLIAHSSQDIPMGSITPIIYVRGYTAIDGTAQPLGAQLQAVGGTTVIQQTVAASSTGLIAASVASTAIAFAASDITIQRIINQVGLTSELNFNIKNGAGAVGPLWRLVIDFPTYYSPRLSNNRNLTVLVNNNSANYQIADHRQLTIRIPNIAIANASTFNVRIIGISHPKYTVSAGTFWVALDNDGNSDAFIQAGTVNDAASAVEPAGSLWLYNTTVAPSSGADLRNGATWTWSIITKSALTAGQILVIAFPDTWSDALAVSSLKGSVCSAVAGAWTGSLIPTSAAAASFWSISGNRVKLNITAAVAANAGINITCTNVRLPDNIFRSAGCIPETPSFIVVDAAESAVVAASSRGVNHFMRNVNVTIPGGANLANLNWMMPQINLIQGTSSPMPAVLAAPGGAFVRSVSLTLNPSNPNISITPAQPGAQVGDQAIAFGVAASNTAPHGINYLIFSKSETTLNGGAATDAYGPISPIRVMIGYQIVPLMNPAAFSVPVGGKSVPVMYNWDLPPQSDITVNFAANDSSITVTPASATLGPRQRGVAVVVSVPATATVGAAFNISIASISGTNAPAFTPASLASTVVVFTAAAAQTDSPTVNVALDNTNAANSATKQGVTVTIGSTNVSASPIPPVSLFWNCVPTFAGINRDLFAVQAMVANQSANGGPNNMNGEIFGAQSVASPSATGSKLLIEGLKANTSYSCRFWAVNQGGNNGSNATTFTTAGNGGKLLKVRFNFDASKYTATSNQGLLCWLSQTFAVKAMAIRSINNEFCGSTGALPTAYNHTMNQTDLNLTVVQVPFFFLPNLGADNDNFWSLVQGAITNAAWVSALKAAGLGITGIGANNVSVPAVPSLTGDTAANVSGGATLSGYSMNTSGYVYAVLLSNDSAAPSLGDLIRGAGPNGAQAIAVQVDYNDGGNFSQGALTFANLTAPSYNLYWTATCDDPSENALSCATPIKSAVVAPGDSTPAPSTGSTGTTNAMMISYGIGLISLIFALIMG